jgi:hypothetical protein
MCRALAARIVLHAEYLKDLPSVDRIAEGQLKVGLLRKSNRFLTLDAIDRQSLCQHDNKNAIRCLAAAIELGTHTYPGILTRTHLELGSILAESDPAAA